VRELPDRDDRADEREWRDDRVHAGAVGQARVDARARLVDVPAERGDDPVDDPADVLVVQEDDVDPLDLALPLDVDVAGAVDHDLGDRLVVEVGLDRPEAGDLVDDLLDELLALVAGHRELVVADDLVDHRGDPGPDVLDLLEVEEGVDRLGHLRLDEQAQVRQQLVAGRQRRGALRRLDLLRDNGGHGHVLATAAIPFHPLQQRHAPRPPPALARYPGPFLGL
jgi:hypothetical protein